MKLLFTEDQLPLFEEKGSIEQLEAIEKKVAACTKCELHSTRTQTVFGRGNSSNPYFAIIAEAPGADEDLQGIPFVGRAGKKLTECLEKLGIPTDWYYILNVIKCRPPDNRKPFTQEVEACRSYFESQIKLIRPRMLLLLGATAAEAILGTKEPMMNIRKSVYRYESLPVRVTFHPSYILRDPTKVGDFMVDLNNVKEDILKIKAKG